MIIGKPKDSEGTYQATSRLRLSATNTWGNVLCRPWAIEEPHNTRQEVDQGLVTWSKGSPTYRQQHQRLKLLYPKAVAALTKYYASVLKYDHKKAVLQADSSIDLAQIYP
ncbi:MAG: hypothetical protein K8F91_25895 [Candidatus Obscuribacterales bacterium]|nr:hypothetical protein [Candidatus Obscuribacterales bacterium]